MLFIGVKDYFYIGLIIVILVYFLIIKKNESFTTTSTTSNDINLTESIKNLGIIAKEMIDDEYITIFGAEKIRIPNLDSVDNIINFVEEQN